LLLCVLAGDFLHGLLPRIDLRDGKINPLLKICEIKISYFGWLKLKPLR
jgi:hypothetical protein